MVPQQVKPERLVYSNRGGIDQIYQIFLKPVKDLKGPEDAAQPKSLKASLYHPYGRGLSKICLYGLTFLE